MLRFTKIIRACISKRKYENHTKYSTPLSLTNEWFNETEKEEVKINRTRTSRGSTQYNLPQKHEDTKIYHSHLLLRALVSWWQREKGIKMPKLTTNKKLLRDMLRSMLMTRLFEEKIEDFFMQNLIGGTVHLYIGQEAVASGACAAIGKEDYIVSNHRGHGHCIAKGGDVKKIMAEILGKETGYCRGKGGSMHVSDIDIGNLGANGIVGAGIPIATGAALALKLQQKKQVVVCFFGDGASNTGAFHEGINLASIYSLPVIFVCENNCYAISSPVSNTFCIPNISERAQSYGIPGVSVDGMDVLAVYETMNEAVKRVRKGGGPVFIECMTYRFKGHYIGDPGTYRSTKELNEWKNKDPIEKFKKFLKKQKILTQKIIQQTENEVQQEIEAAAEFALNSPEPIGEEAFQAVYENSIS